MSRSAQVLVAGGGPAGAAAALVLARCGRRVLLAGGGAHSAFRIGESVPSAVRPLLRDLGVLDRVLADGPRPCYSNVSVWGTDEPVVRDFIFDPNGHGWHVDRVQFDGTLLNAARDAGAELLPDARVAAVTRDHAGWCATLTAGGAVEEVRCEWLVDATGRGAAVARKVGAVRHRADALVAFYTRFRAPTGTDRDARTAVEAEPGGWWYTALVPSGERVVALLTDADLVDRSAVLTEAGFVARLGESRFVRGVLAAHGYELIEPPRGADAGTARLDCVTGPGWVAVGDAAVSFDPLSSQGILTAMFTGLRAGLALDRALTGDLSGLTEYARRVDEIDRTYRRNRDLWYAAEGRWSAFPFWRRRNGDRPRA